MDMITQVVTVLIIILLSMTLHEAMHAFAAYWLGDDTAKHEGRLTLNPIVHIDPFMTIILPLVLALTGGPIFGGAKPVPMNPMRLRYGEVGAAIVGAAGPLTNLLIAFVFFGALVLSGVTTSSTAGMVMLLAVQVNLGFFLFNILPIPPLDGSRILYAVAPDPVREFMDTIERYGIIVIFAIVLLLSPIIGTFMAAGVNFFLRIFAAIFGVVMV